MLTDSPLRSRSVWILFLLSAIVTAGILAWTWSCQASLRGGEEESRGLSTIFLMLFANEDHRAAALELLILAAAVFLASKLPAGTILRWIGEHPVVIAGLTAMALCAGSLFVYHDHPLSMDEYAARFQSQVFAAGHVAGRFPVALRDWLIPPGFQDAFFQISHTDGRVTSAYWPGHALLMTPFTFVGAPWAFNPVVSALTLLVIHRIALELFETVEAAGLALLLTIASPVIFGLGISYYSMPSHLLANALYALLLMRPTAPRVFGAGIVGSVALTLHNPVPHALFALPWIIWVATRPGGLRLLGLLLLGYAPIALSIDLGWFEFSNELRRAGRIDAAEELSAMERISAMLDAFSPPTTTVWFARAIGVAKVWVWAVPGIMILAITGFLHWRRKNAFCLLLAASALTTLAGYLFFIQDQGHGWGFRYFHSAWLALPLLATAAFFAPEPAGDPARDAPTGPFSDAGTKQFVTACALLTLVFGIGWRAWEMQNFIAHDIQQVPHYAGQERRFTFIHYYSGTYNADLIQNDPFLRNTDTLLYSHGDKDDARLMSTYFPGFHRVYRDHYGSVWSQAPAPVTARPR